MARRRPRASHADARFATEQAAQDHAQHQHSLAREHRDWLQRTGRWPPVALPALPVEQEQEQLATGRARCLFDGDEHLSDLRREWRPGQGRWVLTYTHAGRTVAYGDTGPEGWV